MTRAFLSFLLLICMWLPSHSCSGYEDATGKFYTSIPADADSTQFTKAKEMYVPIERVDRTSVSGWLALWAYLWVLPVLAYAWWRPESIVPDAVTLLVAPVAWWMLDLRILETREYGTYVALTSITVLWLLSVRGLFVRRRRLRRRDAVPA